MNTFLEIVFEGINQCKWRWHKFIFKNNAKLIDYINIKALQVLRSEWQIRYTIHDHGAAGFINDPVLINLSTEVYIGRLKFKYSLFYRKIID